MSHMVYEPPVTHKNRKYMSKRRNGFRHFGEVNYSYPRRVVHCDYYNHDRPLSSTTQWYKVTMI